MDFNIPDKIARTICSTVFVALASLGSAAAIPGETREITLSVDAAADRQAIHPEIYGVMFGTEADLKANNTTLSRHGGNYATRYNWVLNASNHARAWYLSRVEPGGHKPAGLVDAVMENSRAAGASAMITIPICGWVAKLALDGDPLWSYSIAKYGLQTGHGTGEFSDAGTGFRSHDGAQITNNDPTDANQPSSPEFQGGMVKHLVDRWGKASEGGVRYYLMDNEPSIWWANHGDVIRTGTSTAELRDAIAAYATVVRQVDPSALIGAPEEWGWNAFFYSGLDQQWGDAQKKITGNHPEGSAPYPDRAARGGMDNIPWLLKELCAREKATGVRLLDVFTFHCYPAGGEFGDDVSKEMQLRRNRSTRMLWDPNYRDESWINDTVRMIPRMRDLVANYYPGLQIGLTEYDWGAVDHINGATAQADVLGIFGREGLDLATREQVGIHGIDDREGLDLPKRWTPPAGSTMVDKAFQMYRNYDGRRSTFGDTRVRIVNSANVDDVSSFAAERSKDGALTVMIVAKVLTGVRSIDIGLNNFAAGDKAQVWQLTAAGRIDRLVDLAVTNSSAKLSVPAQSVTLVVFPRTPVSP